MANLLPPVRIFASYSRDDAVVVLELIKFMRSEVAREGGSIWVDSEEIKVGDRWPDATRKHLAAADIFLAFVSQSYLDDTRYAAKETALALDRYKSDQIIIFPIILSPCTWQRHEWLADINVVPSKKSLQEYKGAYRTRIIVDITNQLLQRVKNINEERLGQQITFGNQVRGLLNRKALYYPITLSKGQTITVELQAPANGADLELLSPDFTPIQQIHVNKAYINTSCYGIFNYKVASDGLYIIRVSKGTGEYFLEVSNRSFGRVHGELELNKTISNALDPREFHRWLISLPANLEILIEAETNDRTADLELWAVDGPDAHLRERVKTDKFGGTLAYWNTIEYQTLEMGNYMVSVISGDGTNYKLTVRVVD